MKMRERHERIIQPSPEWNLHVGLGKSPEPPPSDPSLELPQGLLVAQSLLITSNIANFVRGIKIIYYPGYFSAPENSSGEFSLLQQLRARSLVNYEMLKVLRSLILV